MDSRKRRKTSKTDENLSDWKRGRVMRSDRWEMEKICKCFQYMLLLLVYTLPRGPTVCFCRHVICNKCLSWVVDYRTVDEDALKESALQTQLTQRTLPKEWFTW